MAQALPRRASRASAATTSPSPGRASPASSTPPRSSPRIRLLVHAPVGVVGAIIPWNGPLGLIGHKVEVSELLVTDPRIDKITFTGSTAAGRRIASLCGERIARATLELGGESAAVILDDADLEGAAQTIAAAECMLSGQVCSSLTRLIVTEKRHDAFVEALSEAFSTKVVGDPFDTTTEMGPLAAERDRVEHYIAKGKEEGATLATGGGRPSHLDKGWFVEPTVFGNVDNSATIAREEIFGPVLTVIPARDEARRHHHRQRHHLRPQLLGLHPRPRPSQRRSRRTPLRHGRPQRLPHRLRRLQAIRPRPRGRPRKPPPLPRGENRDP